MKELIVDQDGKVAAGEFFNHPGDRVIAQSATHALELLTEPDEEIVPLVPGEFNELEVEAAAGMS